jgi:hypothetical protein
MVGDIVLKDERIAICNCRHAMIRHQNALAMFLASVLMRGIHTLNVHNFKYFQGGGVNTSCKCTGYEHGNSIAMVIPKAKPRSWPSVTKVSIL